MSETDSSSYDRSVQGFGPKIARTLRGGIEAVQEWFYPFLNPTVFCIMAWANTGLNMKSNKAVQKLVDEVLLADNFKCEDLQGFQIAKETKRLDSADKPDNLFTPSDGWHDASVKISVPKEGFLFTSEEEAPKFEVPDIFHRKISEV